MKLRLVRVYATDNETIGVLSLPGENGSYKEECFTLEDEYQLKKIYGETRIPRGTYKIGLRTTGRMHDKYSRKFSFHEGMLQLENVPNFKFILIHIGNDKDDTSGCILVSRKVVLDGRFTLEDSTTAYKKFYKKVIHAAKNKNLFIQIV